MKLNQKAFTLVENMAAITIFVVALLGLVMGATSIMRSNKTSYFNTVASNLAQSKLEELKSQSAFTVSSGGPDTTTVQGATFSRVWTVTPNFPVPGVRKIDVTVSWTDYKNNSVTISSAVKE